MSSVPPSRTSTRGGDRMRALGRPGALGLLLTAALGVPASAQVAAQIAGPAAEKPNVLLIVCDTLRADRLGCYGNPRDTSPAIDAFAARATRYTRALSSAPWTLPTHASLFTGMHPFEHGVHTYEPNGRHENLRPLAQEHLTLAEALSELGYATGGIISNRGWFEPIFQLHQGFDDWELQRAHAGRMNLSVVEWLRRHVDEPFFLFLNYSDTHYIYNTRPNPRVPGDPAIRDKGELLTELTRRVMPAEEPVPEDLVAMVLDQYDTAVANLDDGIGALLIELEALELYDDTVIVLTSDHGEAFGEHHLVEHCKDVYQEVLQVPLIVKGVGQAEGRTVDRPTTSADVAGLILSALPEQLTADVRPLFPNIPGEAPVLSENYWARLRDLEEPAWGHRFDRTRHAYVEWPYKYIASSDGRHELYDLEADPRESRNLVEAEAERARHMAEALRRLMEAPRGPGGSPEPVELDEDTRATLRALGYLGGSDDR